MSTEKNKTSGRDSVLVARLDEIAGAVQRWFDSLETPKNKTAQALLGVSHRAISRWRRDGGAPSPIYMQRLWNLTGDEAFLLTQAERATFLTKNKEVPTYNFPDLESWEAKKEKLSRPPPKAESSGEDSQVSESSFGDLPADAVGKMITASMAIVQGGLMQLEVLLRARPTAVNATMKQKSASFVARLIKAFALTGDDFKQPEIENDPRFLQGLAELLNALNYSKEK